MPNWHVSTAAEAIAAAQFARLEYDVSVQYGANQPEYDLMVAAGERMLKVSVKGSSDGGWGLTQTQLTSWRKMNPEAPTDYHAAADMWLARHKARTALCFVNFREVDLEAMPRIYLAWPLEVAQKLKAARDGRGDTVLYDIGGTRTTPYAVVPAKWTMSGLRVKCMIEGIAH
jgi:hypothetical protein